MANPKRVVALDGDPTVHSFIDESGSPRRPLPTRPWEKYFCVGLLHVPRGLHHRLVAGAEEIAVRYRLPADIHFNRIQNPKQISGSDRYPVWAPDGPLALACRDTLGLWHSLAQEGARYRCLLFDTEDLSLNLFDEAGDRCYLNAHVRDDLERRIYARVTATRVLLHSPRSWDPDELYRVLVAEARGIPAEELLALDPDRRSGYIPPIACLTVADAERHRELQVADVMTSALNRLLVRWAGRLSPIKGSGGDRKYQGDRGKDGVARYLAELVGLSESAVSDIMRPQGENGLWRDMNGQPVKKGEPSSFNIWRFRPNPPEIAEVPRRRGSLAAEATAEARQLRELVKAAVRQAGGTRRVACCPITDDWSRSITLIYGDRAVGWAYRHDPAVPLAAASLSSPGPFLYLQLRDWCTARPLEGMDRRDLGKEVLRIHTSLVTP